MRVQSECVLYKVIQLHEGYITYLYYIKGSFIIQQDMHCLLQGVPKIRFQFRCVIIICKYICIWGEKLWKIGKVETCYRVPIFKVRVPIQMYKNFFNIWDGNTKSPNHHTPDTVNTCRLCVSNDVLLSLKIKILIYFGWNFQKWLFSNYNNCRGLTWSKRHIGMDPKYTHSVYKTTSIGCN